MVIQKATITMDNPFDHRRLTIQKPRKEGIMITKEKSKKNAKEKISDLL